MKIAWQRNQNGIWFADYKSSRLYVARPSPRHRKFVAKLDGVMLGAWMDVAEAMRAAEKAAIAKTNTAQQ